MIPVPEKPTDLATFGGRVVVNEGDWNSPDVVMIVLLALPGLVLLVLMLVAWWHNCLPACCP
jgi:hypothetical protein